MNIIYITGPSGSGKSRLMARNKEALESQNYSVLCIHHQPVPMPIKGDFDFVLVEKITRNTSMSFNDQAFGLEDFMNAVDGIKKRGGRIGEVDEAAKKYAAMTDAQLIAELTEEPETKN